MQKSFFLPETILCIIVTYLLTYIVHGSVHEAIAYCYGLTDSPWVYFNRFPDWLQNVRENREYAALDQQANFFRIGLIGFSGYISNWALLLFSMRVLPDSKGYWVSFIYWLAIWNLTAIIGYIPHHIFNTINLNSVFNSVGISVWMVYVIGGTLCLVMMILLFYQQLQTVFEKLEIDTAINRRIFFTISILIILFYSTIRVIVIDEDQFPIITHLRFWIAFSGIIFWVKVVLFAIISYNIRLTSNEDKLY